MCLAKWNERRILNFWSVVSPMRRAWPSGVGMWITGSRVRTRQEPWARLALCAAMTGTSLYLLSASEGTFPGEGGTDLERGYGDVRPWRPPFHASPVVHARVPFQAIVSSQAPFWEKIGKFTSIFAQILALKPPNLEIFSSQAPHFGNPGRTPLPKKKLSAPPPGGGAL